MSDVTSFEVTGDWRHIVDDGMVDGDNLPDEVPLTGKVVFKPVYPTVATAGVPVTAYTLGPVTALIAGGVLNDLQGRPGVMLAGKVGEHTVRWSAETSLRFQEQKVDYPRVTFDLTEDVRLTGIITQAGPSLTPTVVDPRIEALAASVESVNLAVVEAEGHASTAAEQVPLAKAEADRAEGLAGAQDTHIAGVLEDPQSATHAAFKAVGNATYGTIGELGAYFDVITRGADPTGTIDSTAAIQSAIDAASATRALNATGATVFLPPGSYLVSNLVLKRGVRVVGASRRATRLHASTGSVFAWATGTVSEFQFAHIHMSTSGTGSHVISLTGSAGLALGSFTDVYLSTFNPDASLFHMVSTGAYIDVEFTDFELNRPAGSSVPGWRCEIDSNNCMSSTWRRGRVHGNGTTAAPFFEFRCTAGASWFYGLHLEDITGEMNLGGLVHAYAVASFSMHNVRDYDGQAGYVDDIFRVGANSGRGSVNVTLRQCSVNAGTVAAGKFDINVGDPNNRSVLVDTCDRANAAARIAVNNSTQVINPRTDPNLWIWDAATTAFVEMPQRVAAAAVSYLAPLSVRPSTSAAAFYVGQRFASGHGLDLFLESAGATTSRLLRAGRTTDTNPRFEIDRAGKLYNGPGSAVAINGVNLAGTLTLPAASPTWRGHMVMVQGDTDVADVLYICMKRANNAYTWQAVATPS